MFLLIIITWWSVFYSRANAGGWWIVRIIIESCHPAKAFAPALRDRVSESSFPPRIAEIDSVRRTLLCRRSQVASGEGEMVDKSRTGACAAHLCSYRMLCKELLQRTIGSGRVSLPTFDISKTQSFFFSFSLLILLPPKKLATTM